MHEDLVKRLIEIETHIRIKERGAQNKAEKRKYMERSVTIGDAVYALTVPGWISVERRLPEKAGQYLTFHNPSCIRVTGFSPNLESVDQYEFPGRKRPGWYDYDSKYGYYECRNITYWMPLPEPPEEDNSDA